MGAYEDFEREVSQLDSEDRFTQFQNEIAAVDADKTYQDFEADLAVIDQPDYVSDTAKAVTGGLVSGIGSGLRGAGEAFREGGELVAEGVNVAGQALGYDPQLRAENPLRGAAEYFEQSGQEILDTRTPAAIQAERDTTPTGNVFTGEDISLGEDPSVFGGVQQIAKLGGQILPQLGAAILTRGQSIPTQLGVGAAVAGAQGGGSAAKEQGDYVRGLSHEDLLNSPDYQSLLKTQSPEQAQETLAQEAEKGAFQFAAPIAGAGGAVIGGLAGKPLQKALGGGVLQRAAVTGTTGAIEEGVQETLEGVGQRVGSNLATGLNQDVGEESFANFALGAVGGAGMGSAGALANTDIEQSPTNQVGNVRQPSTQDTLPQTNQADITRKNGQPFKSERAASLYAKNQKGIDENSVAPVAVDGGFVLRPTQPSNPAIAETTKLIKDNFRHAQKMFDEERFQVVQSASELPEHLAAKYAEGRNPQGLYDVDTDTSYFVADQLNKENIKGAVLHETWHRTVAKDQKLQAKLPELNKQLDNIYRHASRGTGNLSRFYQQAVERMPKGIPESQQLEEFAAYAIEEYTNNPKNLPQRVAQWVRDVLANVRRFLIKGGAGPKNISPADLASIARSSFAANTSTSQGSGQRFSYAGKQANTANLSRLVEAEAMRQQGITEEQIRQQTGWFNGLDGKPRFEINDTGMALKALTPESSTNPDVYADWADEAQNRENGIPLANAIEHDQLFKAYPRLKAARLKVSESNENEASYDPENNVVYIKDPYSYKDGPEGARSALIHEIQHAVQTIEGFARGGTPKEFNPSYDENYVKNLGDEYRQKLAEMDYDVKALKSNYPELYNEWKNAPTKHLGHENYRKLAGEIEARDTESRLNLTPEQRAVAVPYSSQDTTDPIVKFGKSSAESASAMKSVKANIRRGKAAMDNALLNKSSVNRAMFRQGMGWVDFVWGDEGGKVTAKGKRPGAKGISHILEARQRKDGLNEQQAKRILSDLVETIAKGREVTLKEFNTSTRATINDGAHEAILVKKKGSNSWMVTGYEVHGAGDIGAGSDAPIPTRSESTPARNRTGAASDDGKTGNDVLPSTLSKSTLTRNEEGADNSKITDSKGSSSRYSVAAEQFELPFGEFSMDEDSASRKLFDTLVFKLQDKFNSLKRVQTEATKNTGDELSESEDAYLAELRYHGQAGAKIEDFTSEQVDPLLESINKAGLKIEDVDVYLHARHAPEANAQLKRINPDRENNAALSGMSDEYAEQVINSFTPAQRKALEDIGNQVDAITKKTRNLLKTSGLETYDTIKKWEETYDHYVPLHREGKGKRLSPKGRGFDTRGKTKRRAGSERRVVNVLAHVVSQYEHTAIRSEKAKVGRAFLEFAKNHPSDLWEIDKVEYTPSFNTEGLVSYRPDPSYQLADNVLIVKVNGKDHRITFNTDNIHAARIAHALKNLGAGHSGPVINVLSKFNRYLAAVNTSLNPEFVISNASRDLQTAAYNLSSTEADGLIGKVLKDVPNSWKGIRDFQKRRNTEWANHYKEFRRAGAKTGWMEHYSNIEQREQNLQKKLDTMQDGKLATIKRGINAVGQFIEDENTAIENAIRLSAFVHARKKGISVAKSARLAKELTVNFNRKGDLGEAMNAMYLFYNAGIQGSVRLIEAARKSPKVRKMMVATVGFAVMMDLINRASGGEDDDGEPYYDKIPDWIKDHNLIIMRGEGKYFKIPLPWGYNVLHTMGQVIGEGISKSDFDASEGAARFAGSVVGAFNPIGGEHSLTQMLSPTITDPLVQWETNSDYAGRPLRPERNPFDIEKPDSQRYFNSVREPSKWFTDKLNELTGGDKVRPGAIDISPESLDLIYDHLTGGLGRFLGDAFTTPMKAYKGEKVESHTIPLLRKVYAEPRDSQVKSRYYEYMDNIRRTEQQWKYYATDPKKRLEIRRKYGDEVRLIKTAKAIKRTVQKLNKDKGLIELQRDGAAKREKLKRINDATNRVMTNFNRLYYNRVVKKANNDG